jgi:hypothetical protein
MSTSQTGFFDSLMSAVRENPLAAALVGGGALWLLVGNDKLMSAARAATTVASPLADVAASDMQASESVIRQTSAPPTAPDMDQGSFRVAESLRQASSAASDAVSGTADKIKGRFDDGISYLGENIGKMGDPLPGKEALTKAHSLLADMLERQPLLLGAVGLAIGGTVAGAFRTADVENEWVGDLSDEVRANLNTRAEAVSHSLREASDTLKAEITETGAEAVDRMKQAGIDAADAAREKARSP